MRLEKILSSQKMNKKSHSGHHKRLRERFIKSGLDGFHDYEVLDNKVSGPANALD